jgi:hypothetical protein
MKLEKFEDPYKFNSHASIMSSHNDGENMNKEGEDSKVPSPRSKEPEFRYLLGNEHKKDIKGGDAGGLMKRAQYYPVVDFIRSSFNGKVFNSL